MDWPASGGHSHCELPDGYPVGKGERSDDSRIRQGVESISDNPGRVEIALHGTRGAP
jgi:hypothetical protein